MIDENLKKAIRDNKLVLFIGAGASTSLKLPSWKNLVLGILEKLDLDFSETSDLNFSNLKNSLNNGSRSPLEILNKLENDSNSGALYKTKAKEYVYSVFNEINTSHSLDSELHKLLWKLSQKIITTNYDQILEANQPDRTIDVFENANSFLARKSQQDNSKFLYKIHGDFKNPETIILFESDYKLIYSNNNANNDALGDFFKNKTFLFLGFSLSDPFVNDLFSKIKSLYSNYTVGDHYILSTNQNNDFSKYDVKSIKIDNWDDSLKNYLEAIIEEKNKIENINEVVIEKNLEELPEESIDSLFILVKNKTEELIKNPSDKNLASEIHDIQSKINKLIYGPLNFLKTFDNEYKNTHLKMLFDTIYGNEKLNEETINEINRIRTDYKNHQWYERCQLVTALTCSLFIFNKADDKKISLLVDFINDSEDKVWERTLTYLVMLLNHLGNKWLRFDSIKRKVKSLTLNIKVQDACQSIVEYILLFGIGRFNFATSVFENEHFRDNPYNYFLPFFKENNPLFENIFENYKGDNIEKFINVLEKSPLPDSIKYILCNTEIRLEENKDVDKDDNEFIVTHLSVNNGYYPFAGYIQEFVSFINSFPSLQHNKLIDTQLKITSTPLKDYLLSEKEKFRILGIHFHKEKSWGQAIINFEKYLKLNPDDLSIYDNLANCYLSNKEPEKAKEISMKIRSEHPKYISNLTRLADIYFSEKNFHKALNIYNECLIINNENPNLHYEKTLIYIELKNYEEALECIQNAEKLNFENQDSLNNTFGVIYQNLKRYNEALKYFNEAILLNESKAIFYSNRASLYGELNNYHKAIEDIDKAINLDPSESLIYMKVYYLIYLNEFELAFSLLNKIKIKDENYYNTLANYYRLEGNFNLAFSIIDKAISLNGDEGRLIGTKTAIYASMNDDENFFKYLNEILSQGENATNFLPDIKNKYKNNKKFLEILEKYNQKI